jgi:hypothetical protein
MSGRAGRSAALPECAKLAAKFLTGGGPIGADAFAQLAHASLDVQLVLLQPRHVELLARRAAVQLTCNVFVVVADNPARFLSYGFFVVDAVCLLGDDACRTDPLCSLGYQELARFLDRSIYIVSLIRTVRDVIVSHVVYLILFHESRRIRDDPRAVLNDLINPFTMPHALGAFLSREHSKALPSMCLLISSDADNQVHVGERKLGLLQLTHVSLTIISTS